MPMSELVMGSLIRTTGSRPPVFGMAPRRTPPAAIEGWSSDFLGSEKTIRSATLSRQSWLAGLELIDSRDLRWNGEEGVVESCERRVKDESIVLVSSRES
jgi:hypothetical protein